MDKEVDVNQTATPKKKRGGARYPKGVMPPQFVGKGFDAHPENINKDGGAIRSINALRKRAQEIGNELVEFEFGKGKNKVKMKMTRTDRILLDWHVSQEYSKQKSAIEYSYGKVPEKLEVEDDKSSVLTALPADVIAPDFLNAYRDIKNKKHTEYLFYGGRGSTKSSFVSLVIPWLLINNPTMHALATRQVANTLRDSVFSQIQWAIGELGLSDSFKCTVSPMEIQYIPTGQTIYFRGADDPNKIKSIKPPFGYIGILWFEELDQFYGQESIRKIEQSVIRGGDEAFIFKSFNPSKTSGNWANKYVQIPKVTQYQHKSSYLTVPTE